MPKLRRSHLTQPGIRRRKAGRGFTYVDVDGRRLTDAAALERIRALVLPPAWEDVWICPWPNGHIQAVGTDARGRRQYRYHDVWRIQRDREKFGRMLELARVLPAIRSTTEVALELPGMPSEKVLACAVRLLDRGFFRVGGEEYAEENGSYGLATLRRDHAHVHGDELVFEYTAKGGKDRVQSIVDPPVRAVVAALKRRRGGGEELLAYQDGRRWVDVQSGDINAYLRQVSGAAISAKDFRTWHATVLASVGLAVSWNAATPTAQQRAIRRVVCEVATYLGNTPAVCRTSYIDPRVVDRYREGVTIRSALDDLATSEMGLSTHGPVEAAVLDMLDEELAIRAA